MRVCLILLCACTLFGSDPAAIQRAAALRMQIAISRQTEAVRRQAPAPTGVFFTTPWVRATAALPVDASTIVRADCDSIADEDLRPLISAAAAKEGVNPLLIRAIIRRESGARPCAISDKGAQGLMQLMPVTQEYLGVANPFDPAENISAGTRYMRELLTRYKGNLQLALAAYNAGPQRVDATQSVPNIAETRSYVTAVLRDLHDNEEEQP